MNFSPKNYALQVILLITLLALPFSLFIIYMVAMTDSEYFLSLALPLHALVLTALITAQASRYFSVGKEDYVLIPLLLIYFFPFRHPLLIIPFILLATAAFFLLKKTKTGKRI